MKLLCVAISLTLFHFSSIQAVNKEYQEATNPGTSNVVSTTESTDSDDDRMLIERATLVPPGDKKLHISMSEEDRREIPVQGARLIRKKSKEKSRTPRKGIIKNYWPDELPHIGSMTPYRFLLENLPMDLEYFPQLEEKEETPETPTSPQRTEKITEEPVSFKNVEQKEEITKDSVFSKKPEDKKGSVNILRDTESFKRREEKSLYEGCEPMRSWNLFRHDIRYPSKETTHGMRTRLRNIKESVLLKLYENEDLYNTDSFKMEEFLNSLDKWDVEEKLSKDVVYVSTKTLNERKSKKQKQKEMENLPPEEQSARLKKRKGGDEKIDEAKDLTPEGVENVKLTAGRYHKRLKTLFDNVDPESRLFKFTDCQRTRASATEFYSVIYGRPAKEDESWHAPVETGDEGKDPLLKYDALCGHWKRNYKKSQLNAHQLVTFETGNQIKSTLEGIRDILRFTAKSITFSDGKLLYETCAFEMAWGKRSPWCILMAELYLAVFEYLEDYEYFKNDGPDNDMNEKVGCFLFKDMIERLIGDVHEEADDEIIWNLREGEEDVETAKEKHDETDPTKEKTIETDPTEKKASKSSKSKSKKKSVKKITFYFTHLTAILKFITHLRFLDIDDNEKERLTVDNFAEMGNRKWRTARIGAFGTNISINLMKCKKSYSILVMHQERPVKLPGCKFELCLLDDFLKEYRDSIFNCNYDEICKKYKNPMFSRSLIPFRDTKPTLPFTNFTHALRTLSFEHKEV